MTTTIAIFIVLITANVLLRLTQDDD